MKGALFMNNKNIKTIDNTSSYIVPAFYTELPEEDKTMTPEEEAKFMENIDMEEIDRVIAFLETQEDNPDKWISWEESMEDIRRTILNE